MLRHQRGEALLSVALLRATTNRERKSEWRTAATTTGSLLPDEVVSWSAFLSKETVRVYAVSADLLGCAISGSGTLE